MSDTKHHPAGDVKTGQCPICGKRLTLNSSGYVRNHKAHGMRCVGSILPPKNVAWERIP